MSRLSFALCLVFLVLAANGARAADEWGTITGRFVYEGDAPTPKPLSVTKDVETFGSLGIVDESVMVDSNGGLANVAIFVKSANVNVHPDIEANFPEKVTIDNKGGRFEPHICPMWVDKQTLVVLNSDPVSHNTNVTLLGDQESAFNSLLTAGEQIERKVRKRQQLLMLVQCNIHPWMNARILPRDNPYYAVSAADGTFTIANMPAGDLDFVALHEKSGRLITGLGKEGEKKGEFILKVAPGDNPLGDIVISRENNAKLYK